MIRAFGLILLLATPVAAQDAVVFDPSQPYFVQQIMGDQILLESAGRQFVCGLTGTPDVTGGNDVLVPVSCKIFGTPQDAQRAQDAGALASNDVGEEAASLEDVLRAQTMIVGMPPPAFQAALVSVFNQMGCVVDFSDVEATQDMIVRAMGAALDFSPLVIDDVYKGLDDRIGRELNAMEDRFVVDEIAHTVTLVEGCTQ